MQDFALQGRGLVLMILSGLLVMVLYSIAYSTKLSTRAAATGAGLQKLASDAMAESGFSAFDVSNCARTKIGELSQNRSVRNTGTRSLVSERWSPADLFLGEQLRAAEAFADALQGCLIRFVEDTPGIGIGEDSAQTAESNGTRLASRAVGLAYNAFTSGPAKSFYGPEQLVCYLLFALSLVILSFRWRSLRQVRSSMQLDEFDLPEAQRITPTQAVVMIDRSLREAAPKSLGGFYRNLALEVLLRFESTKDLAAAERVARYAAEDFTNRFTTSLTTVRYAVWAIPSIGFIGTVRGIGEALGHADRPEDLPAIVSFLGTAFDTTLVALLLVIPLQALVFALTSSSDSIVDAVLAKAERSLVSKLVT
ncbi:MAG: MotA/TolQ/ExbB proton channel family protein [Candidatus Thiodiazotropha sp.]